MQPTNQDSYLSLKYRPDIDGLRAFAVLAVVFYHASTHFGGGFVGVDIFFVISGFLITRILLNNFHNKTDNNQYLRSIFSFYLRRIRRIFPVLILVLFSCIIAGWFFLLPEEYELLGKHIAAGSIYISNILLWKEAGYFDVSSEVKPLLHLWSLGIEEQFYILWPFLILILFKMRLKFSTFILIFIIISCGINIGIIKKYPTEAFYSPLTRFWELAVGGFIACESYKCSIYWNKLAFLIGKTLNQLMFDERRTNEVEICRNFLSFLGVALLIFSIIRIHVGMHFPGKWALLPTLGTALIIVAGPTAFFNKRILSLKFFVFIGLISYPLYLWHWPLLSFLRILYGEVPSRTARIIAVVMSIILAYMTYKFIEPPLRWGNYGRIKAICLLFIMLIVGGLGLFIYLDKGVITRIESQEYTNRINDIIDFSRKSSKLCINNFPHYGLKDWTDSPCLLQNDLDKIDIAVVGDSHAAQLFNGLVEQDKIKKNHNIAVFPASCNSPYIDLTSGRIDDRTYYRKNSHLLHREAYKYIFENKNIKTVLLAHNPGCSYLSIYDNRNLNIHDKSIILRNGVIRTFDLLKKHNKKVVIVLDNPTFPFAPQHCKLSRRPFSLNNSDKNCDISRKSAENNPARVWYNNIIMDVAKHYDNIEFFNSIDSLCDKSKCPVVKDGKLIYQDVHHLNIEGSIIVAKDLMKFIDNLK